MPEFVDKRPIGSDEAGGPGPVCEVWVSAIDSGPGFPVALLNGVESRRLATYRHDDDRRRFLAGCAMARLFLAAQDGRDPQAVDIDRTCPRCGEPHGKPKAVGSSWQYSVSHSGRYVVVAFCRDLAVGVDIEHAAASSHPADTWRAVLTPKELAALLAIEPGRRQRAFLTCWTRKEAALKCLGVGLTIEPALLEVSGPSDAPAVLRWPPDLPEAVGVSLRDLTILPEHVGALAVQGPAPAVQAFEVVPRL